MRQRHIGDGVVQRLHEGCDHRATHHQNAMAARQRAAGNRTRHQNRSLNLRLWWVSMSIFVLMPARMSEVSSEESNAILTGRRCTTFTQLPLEFSDGSTENCAPVAGAIASTVPC